MLNSYIKLSLWQPGLVADVKLAKTENNLSLAADAAWMSAKLSINVNIRKLKNNYFNKMLNLAGAG